MAVVGLVQVDGKWPNLALMKLAAYHKVQGDEVRWYAPIWREDFDVVYAAKIFSFSADDLYLPDNAIKGGSGYDLQSALPAEIEAVVPDYSIYPKWTDTAIGFTTRGCIRHCPFCIVPEKEGRVRVVGDLYSVWQGQKNLILLDNNLTAAPMEHFELLIAQLEKEKVRVDFSQGLDIRLITEDHARLLARIRLLKQVVRFAWDNVNDEAVVRHGIATLKRYLHPKKINFYVLVGFNSTPEEDMHRVQVLRGLGVDPFVMPYDRRNLYQRRFARWVNHKAIFKSVPWAEYKGA